MMLVLPLVPVEVVQWVLTMCNTDKSDSDIPWP